MKIFGAYITEIKRFVAEDPDPRRCLHEALTFAEHEHCFVELTVSMNTAQCSKQPPVDSVIISISPRDDLEAVHRKFKELAAQLGYQVDI